MWDKLCWTKHDDGLGFQKFNFFNHSMLTKQGWHLGMSNDSLARRILKAWYFPCSNFFKANLSYKLSNIYRSLLKAIYRSLLKFRWILKGRSRWQIGSGQSMHIWRDRWFAFQLWSPIKSSKKMHKWFNVLTQS